MLTFCNKSFSQEKAKTQLFKTSKQSIVLKSDSIDLDKYNNFIEIPHGKSFKKYFEKIGYFKETIDYKTLVKKSKANEVSSITNVAYKQYYDNEERHLMLFLTLGPDNLIDLTLTAPDIGAIFTV